METDSGGLLVDAGLPPRRIGALLGRIGRNLADVNALLLTHGHADHTCGVAALVRERKIEVYAAPGVGESLGANTIAPGEPCSIEDLRVTFF
jgi:ribonuclease Z